MPTLHPQVKFLQADLMKAPTRNSAHWERPFASTISSVKSTQCAWRSNSELRIPVEVGGERRDVIHKLECIGYFTCYYIEWRCVQRQTCHLRAVSLFATSDGSDIHLCMPGLAQQKRDEITWGGGGSVSVALGERDRLVVMPLVTTPEDCIHTSHV